MIGGSLQWGLRQCGLATRETRPGQQRLDAVIAARHAVITGHSDRAKALGVRYMLSDKVCRGVEAVLTSTRFKFVTGSIGAG